MSDHGLVRYLVLGLLATVVLAGCGGEVDPATTPAGAAQVRLIEDLYNGHFGKAYALLHPTHQEWVSRSLFVECARRSIAVHRLDSVEVLDVFDDPIRAPGLGETRAKAVRLRLTSTAGETRTFVNHEVKVGNTWRWILNAAAIRAYRSGTCPRGE
jgi:hypothetical protein